jgi:hypothetical protein
MQNIWLPVPRLFVVLKAQAVTESNKHSRVKKPCWGSYGRLMLKQPLYAGVPKACTKGQQQDLLSAASPVSHRCKKNLFHPSRKRLFTEWLLRARYWAKHFPQVMLSNSHAWTCKHIHVNLEQYSVSPFTEEETKLQEGSIVCPGLPG